MDTSRYRNAKELIEFALSFGVDEIYEAAGNPYPARALANSITPLVVNRAKEAGVGGEDLAYTTGDGGVANILWYGIEDPQRILVPRLVLQPTYEEALGFVRHEKTIQTLAVLALRSEGALSGIVAEMECGAYHPTIPTPYLEQPRRGMALSSSGGCPAAKHASPETIKPIWKDFVVWVGELALKGIVHHEDRVQPAFASELVKAEAISETLATAS